MASNRDNVKNLTINKPGLFSPTTVRGIREGASHQSVNFSVNSNELTDSSILNTGSFKYSVDGQGLRSTQQLNIGWENFENHTFFNSAQVKTNVAFEKIFNEFPFDGSKGEFENFFATLTGYEKWVYDQFPKNIGYMYFTGSLVGETGGGTYVTVKDLAGSAFPTVSTKHTGETVINPANNSMTIEFWVYLPEEVNFGSAVVSKVTGSQGFVIAVEPTGSTASGSVSMYVVSGAISSSTTITLDKGEWNHVAFVWDRSLETQKIIGYLGSVFETSSSQAVEFNSLSTQGTNLYIGSGSQLATATAVDVFTPNTTFSGALDELRIWHTARTQTEIKQYKEKAIFAQDGLKLYYKFNEASGSNSSVILDHSSNSVHGKLNANGSLLEVQNFATGSVAGASPMSYEKLADSPILFPTQPDLIDLRSEILVSASRYDFDNPNLITKLIPVHYFLEGQSQDGLSSEEGDITSILESGADPRSVDLGATQVFLLLLYTWAKFFDEMKLYVQAFSTINAVDYDNEDTVPDQFLLNFARNQGVELPPLFDGSSIEQFLEAENIQSDISTNDLTLQGVRNQIWRRILINLQDVLRSKGTIHSVKSFIRSVGIDPDNNFRIREYGGPSKQPLSFVRDKRNEFSTLLDFVSGGLLTSPFLSASRTEPGFPLTSSVGVAGPNDGLFTSGSFTYEGFYRIPTDSQAFTSQSLVRFNITGSSTAESIVLNLVTVKGGYTTLYVRPSAQLSASLLELSITGADLFDADQWYVNIAKRRSDDGLDSVVSSSYYLRLAKSSFGEIIESYTTSSFYNDNQFGPSNNLWTNISESYNASGSYITIGSQSLNTGIGDYFLNGSGLGGAESTAQTRNFIGRAGHIHFYSKFLSDNEWPEHARYYRSVGVQDPTKNFNFVSTRSGSWERLRADISTDQPITQSDGLGEIVLTDFSQNTTWTGSNFPFTSSVVVPERFFFSYLSPKFDQGATTEKIRVRSFQNFENVQDTPWAVVAPRYDIVKSESPTDNTRFTIDYSVVDALDQDIVTLFANLQSFDNIIGNPELAFSPDYPDLESLRDAYFNKLVDKMNHKLFFEFYKWFDTNIGTFVQQLIPRKTKFLGTNFVIESHMLERPKVEYLFSDIYLGDNTRHSLKDTILLQLITGNFNRY